MTQAKPLLIDTGKGFNLKYKGKLLYSSVDPLNAVRNRVDRIFLEDKTLIFIPSLGLGYGLKELLQKLPLRCHILCIEADQQLMAFALQENPVNLPKDPRLTIIRTASRKGAAKALYDIGAWKFRRVLPLYLCGGYYLERKTYAGMLAVLEEEVRIFWQNRMTLINMSKLWLKNLFENLDLLTRAKDLRCLKTQKPVVVVGAGPSLEESLVTIEKLRDDILLIAVDTSLPVLMDRNIKPDFVFMLESQISNLQDFLPYHGPGMALLCDLTANPLVIRLFKEEVYFFSSRFYPLRILDRLESCGLLPTPFPPLGSVGVAAVHAALEMTSGPVLLTGLDFSYAPGKTHARGAPVNRSMHFDSNYLDPLGMSSFKAIMGRPLLKLKGKDGKEVLSDLVLRSYSLQLEKEIKDTGRVYDLAKTGLPSGARIVHNRKELTEILSSTPLSARRSTEAHPSADETKPFSREAAKAFCENEMHLLLQAEELVGSYLRQKDREDPEDKENMIQILKEVEYAFLHLPDAIPEPSLSRNFLSRVVICFRYFTSRLRQSLAVLSILL